MQDTAVLTAALVAVLPAALAAVLPAALAAIPTAALAYMMHTHSTPTLSLHLI